MIRNSLKILLVILLFLLSVPVSAQEIDEVNYNLPYPGILPDHPLYPLKVARDKIYGFFLPDPLKKAEFKLLMADKRIVMGIMLMDRQKPELSERTISKATKYYEESVISLKRAEKTGKDTNPLRHKLIDASKKYQQIIQNYQKSVTPDIKKGLEDSLERALKYRGDLIDNNLNSVK